MPETSRGSAEPGFDAALSGGVLERAHALGLLLLRVGMGLLLWTFHVRPKLEHFTEELHSFPDPLGLGHGPSFLLALASEALCSVAVACGFATRLLALPIVFTMVLVLALTSRGFAGADVQAALLYALPYCVLVLTGPGPYSIDALLASRSRARAAHASLTAFRARSLHEDRDQREHGRQREAPGAKLSE
jgi:putative oxidoreductase